MGNRITRASAGASSGRLVIAAIGNSQKHDRPRDLDSRRTPRSTELRQGRVLGVSKRPKRILLAA
jgi:hypothetical protein